MIAILAIWLHIAEEALRHFREQRNRLLSGDPERPVSPMESVLVEELGLGVALTIGWLEGGPYRAAVLGFLAGDLVQHVVFALRTRTLFAGLLTAAICYTAVLLRHGPEQLLTLPAALGAAALGVHFLVTRLRARAASSSNSFSFSSSSSKIEEEGRGRGRGRAGESSPELVFLLGGIVLLLALFAAASSCAHSTGLGGGGLGQ